MNKKTLLALFLGLLIGAGSMYAGLCHLRPMWKPHSPWSSRRDPKKMVEKFNKKLNLDPDQKAKVEKILETKQAEIKELHGRVRPQFKTIMEAGQTEIRALLRPDQQAKFDTMTQEFEKRREKFEKRAERIK